MKETKDKPVVFQGTGYRIVQFDKRNLELQIYTGNKYQFRGYFQTVEAALANLIYYAPALTESAKHDIKSYVKTIVETKENAVKDIQRELHKEPITNGASETEDDLFN